MKKFLTFIFIALLAVVLSACNNRGNDKNKYEGLDTDIAGEIDIMLWSGDDQYLKDIGHKNYSPEDFGGQNQASVYAVAKAFNKIYPNIKINVYAKPGDPNEGGVSWYQYREYFFEEHGRWPGIYASTDLAGDIGRGLVADLSQFKDDPMYQSFNPSIMSMMNYYGFQAGLPQFLQPWGVYVNKELAENNNIDVPNYDWTIEEYIRFINQAPGGDRFYGAMDSNFSFFNTGSNTVNAQLYSYDGNGDHVNINSDEIRNLITTYYEGMAKKAIWPVSDAGLLPDGFGESFNWWSHVAFAKNLVLTNDGDPWMMGDAAHPNPDHENRFQSEDWDIYPRPSTPYKGNTVGVVLDPLAVHNYCIDDGNPECSEAELNRIKVAYTFAAFWIGDTRSWQARADQQFLDNGVLKSAMNDSLPLVTGKEFDTQMAIWYSADIHQRFQDKELMPGFHYILELWESGEVWDVSDKSYPMYHTDEGGNRKLNLYEYHNTHAKDGDGNPTEMKDVIGLNDQYRHDPQFVEKVLAKLPEWNTLANQRFEEGYAELRAALKKYYGYTDSDF